MFAIATALFMILALLYTINSGGDTTNELLVSLNLLLVAVICALMDISDRLQ